MNKMNNNLIRSLFENDYAPSQRFKYDLSLAENPFGCSKIVKQSITDSLDNLNFYPDKENLSLKEKISDFYGFDLEQIYIGTGVTGVIQDFCKVFVQRGQHVLMPESTFPGPIFGATIMGGGAILTPFLENFRVNFQDLENKVNFDTSFIFLSNPNNPTGLLEDSNKIIELAKKVRCPVLVSEANIEYTSEKGLLSKTFSLPENLVVMRSFSKIYGLASMRVGFAIGSQETIERLNFSINPFRISTLSEKAACTALDDQEHVKNSIRQINIEKSFLYKELESIGFKAYMSEGNTFIAKTPQEETDAINLRNRLNKKNCSIVPCNQFRGIGEKYIRISPRSHDINSKFISILKDIYS